MQDKPSLLRRLHHDYLAFIYAFTYRTTHRIFLGFSISGWIKTLTLLPPVLTGLRDWRSIPFAVSILVAVLVRLVYWQARRAGYTKFIPEPAAVIPTADLDPLTLNQRVKVWATGIFTVHDREDQVLLRPAEYWQVPLGDHIVMVQAGRERFLYQFFNAEGLQEVQPGCLLFGTRLHRTIAITYLEAAHAIEPMQFNFAKPEDIENSSKQQRTIYFTFENEKTHRAVWHNIVNDVRRARTH